MGTHHSSFSIISNPPPPLRPKSSTQLIPVGRIFPQVKTPPTWAAHLASPRRGKAGEDFFLVEGGGGFRNNLSSFPYIKSPPLVLNPHSLIPVGHIPPPSNKTPPTWAAHRASPRRGKAGEGLGTIFRHFKGCY